MGLLDKIKNALFEEDDEEEKSVNVEETKKQKPERMERFERKTPDVDNVEYKNPNEEIAKKIDITKTMREEEVSYNSKEFNMEKPKSPIIFDDEDFLSDTKELNFKEVPKKEEKILYGGYESKDFEKSKEKFRPSPIISPVYGVLQKSSSVTDTKTDKKSLDHLFVEERKKEVTFDTIRQKAYGYNEVKKEEPVINDEDDEDSLLYEMQEHDEKPGIEKVTLGDAEEYFHDLGLEYNVDYKDMAKAKSMTRSKKNKELTETVEEEIKENNKIEQEMKKKGRPKKVVVPDIEEDYSEPEEKSLYDLIDMMYENKDKE